MTEAEVQALKRGRAYQCLDCEEPMMKYIGERRQVIAHLYKYHVPLDQVPYYCSLCHFLTAEKDKLTSHVKGYTKHVEAAKTLEKSGVPLENFLRANSNPVHLTEGVHFIRLSREESRQHWLKGTASRTGSTGARPLLSPDPTPKIAAPAPAPAAELPEAALAPKSFTFDDLLDEDFSFLDPYLEGDAGTSVSSVVEPQAPQVDQLKDQQVEIERTVRSRTEKATPEVEKELESEVTQRAPTKKVQLAKRKRRESSGSEDSNTSSSSDEESSSESEGEREQEGSREQEESRDEILTELRRTNQHLAKICTCLQEINSKIQGQGETLAKMVGSLSKDTTSPDPRKEEVESRKGVESMREVESRKEVESRREVESREEESRRKEGRENMPAREERNAEEFRKRQRREGEDNARGYRQWQPRRSPRKNKWFSWRR